MDLASKLCNFALTKAVCLVETALDWSGEDNNNAGSGMDVKKNVNNAGAAGKERNVSIRRRRTVRLEIKGSTDFKWSLKCQSLGQRPGSTAAPGRSSTSCSRRRPRSQPYVRTSPASKRQRPMRLLPTIEEEDICTGPAQICEGGIDEALNKDEAMFAFQKGTLTPPTSANNRWEGRLGSRDYYLRCNTRA
eukprot:TRINITY_DN10986_c0_g1_i2.p1 TRINITY_DN10986_c0_g1~~TRINITY_DN10986_c0_g1_i2.p1  ORF type:complete len:191 (-),score=40.58 TRINITY_DN10986_c0_g1_i2:348-920(-)